MFLSNKQIKPIENDEQSIEKKPYLFRSPSWGHHVVQQIQKGKREFVVGGLLFSINESSPNVASQTKSAHRRKASLIYGFEAHGLHFVTNLFKHSPHKGVVEEASKLSRGVKKSLGPSEPSHRKENGIYKSSFFFSIVKTRDCIPKMVSKGQHGFQEEDT